MNARPPPLPPLPEEYQLVGFQAFSPGVGSDRPVRHFFVLGSSGQLQEIGFEGKRPIDDEVQTLKAVAWFAEPLEDCPPGQERLIAELSAGQWSEWVPEDPEPAQESKRRAKPIGSKEFLRCVDKLKQELEASEVIFT